MRSPAKPMYSFTGSIGTDDITAHVILDQKNNTVHIHFYGKIFGDTQKPILVKRSNMKFPETGGVELAKQIVLGEFTNKNVQIERVTLEMGTPVVPTNPPQRTIIRFKK